MKKYLLVIFTLFLSYGTAKSQDESWLKYSVKEAGLDSAKGSRIVIADINNDHYPDLFWGTGGVGKNKYRLMLNVPNEDPQSPISRKFVDITAQSGITKRRDGKPGERVIDVASFADLDNDGDLDVVTSIYYHRYEYYDSLDSQGNPEDPGDRSEVLLNDGNGNFTLKDNNGLYNLNLPQFKKPALTNSTGIAFLDYDYDGKIDIYIPQWFQDRANGYAMKDIFLKGNGDGTFSSLPNGVIDLPFDLQYGANVTDWDNNGWQDILTSPYCNTEGNLFANYQGSLVNKNLEAGYNAKTMAGDNGQALCQWEAEPGDFDNDGDMDLLHVFVHGGYNSTEGRTTIAINQGPQKGYKFVWAIDRIKRDASSGVHFGDNGAQWIDIDNDGWLDMFIGQIGYDQGANERLYILRQNTEHYFDDISSALGLKNSIPKGHSIEPADIDLDGDNDIIFSHQPAGSAEMQVAVLINNIGNKNNWVHIIPEAPASANKAGIGSRIKVYSDDITQIRELQAGLGHFGNQQQFSKTIGIENRNYIDSITVRWPEKALSNTAIYNPPLNTIIKLKAAGVNYHTDLLHVQNKGIIGTDKAYIQFDSIAVGQTDTQVIKLINFGDAPITIGSQSMANDSNTSFALTGTESLTIAPHDSTEATFTFTGKARGSYKAIFSVTSNAANLKVLNIEMRGKSWEAKQMIAVNSDTLLFDSTYINSSSTKEIIIKNIGESTLNINKVEINNSANIFEIDDFNPGDVKPGEEIKLNIKFMPLERKGYTGELVIKSDAYNYPESKVYLSGQGDGPKQLARLDVDTLNFDTVEVNNSKKLQFNIINYGDTTLTISGIKTIFDLKKAFTIIDNTTPLFIAPSEQKLIEIDFKPKSSGSYKSFIKVTTDDYYSRETELTLIGVAKDGTSFFENEAEFNAAIIPNPSNGYSILNINNSKEVIVSVFDELGQKILDLGRFNVNENLNINLELIQLASGTYYINCSDGRSSITLPFIIIK